MIEFSCKKFADNVKKYRETKGYTKSKMAELVSRVQFFAPNLVKLRNLFII